MTEKEIAGLLVCSREDFDRQITAKAESLRGDTLYAAAMLG